MSKLWQKGYSVHQLVERYEAAQNSLLDTRLIRHDVWGSLAHVTMLHHIGALNNEELQELQNAFREVLAQESTHEFTVQPSDEDVHTSIENYLATRTGASGKKIHLARSRNDQVLVDLRLYGKEQLHLIARRLLDLSAAFLAFARATIEVPLPGYTHMQRGMLSSVGLWATSFAEALLDDEQLLAAAYQLNDQSPLGSAAGYGVPLPIDRQLVADLLGFARVQNNVIYVQNARGKIEGAIVQALMQIMLDLSKFAQDALLFTTSEYSFLQVPQELCDGSSIMPQKRNLSIMELVRARTQTMLALQQQILGIVSGLPSGYNMDYQETKRPFMEALDLVQENLEICTLLVNNLQVNEEKAIAACTFELFAADRAYEMALQENIPFRDAYRIVGKEVTAQLDQQLPFPVESKEQLVTRLRARNHLGGAGNPGLSQAEQRLSTAQASWDARSTTFTQAIQALVGTTTIHFAETEEE
ncbi:argininosuccinate lyase [Tengunoibacter tsumagoiensis]|uniref:Argininosuccinate lyase n=1 Tax=Tengunoibacter tsumagoiensis TaxID=2014871 RepID=A0A401ZX72_9CHLR|nr:argininosuccinate lyase [Tengunoibacter tsumagoiensis]GCE11446.1 argininosuccinate lyase [Tengunoibacter tsumagoiensis]